MKLEFTIHGIPITKKNHQQILINRKTGNRFVSQSEAYKQFERDSVIQVPSSVRIGINVPCSIRTIFFMPDDRKVDCSNLISAAHDILVKAGVIADDNRNIAAVINAWCETDKTNPRTEYLIEVI